jgi:hypothetical protein
MSLKSSSFPEREAIFNDIGSKRFHHSCHLVISPSVTGAKMNNHLIKINLLYFTPEQNEKD